VIVSMKGNLVKRSVFTVLIAAVVLNIVWSAAAQTNRQRPRSQDRQLHVRAGGVEGSRRRDGDLGEPRRHSHTVVSTDKVFKSKVLDTDEKYSFTFATPGTYTYFCSIHPKMTGKVIVQ
jgi:Plastocyanin